LNYNTALALVKLDDEQEVHKHVIEQASKQMQKAGATAAEATQYIFQLELSYQERMLFAKHEKALQLIKLDMEERAFAIDIKIKGQELALAKEKLNLEKARIKTEKEREKLITRQVQGMDDNILKHATDYRQSLASYAIQVHSTKMDETVAAFVTAVETFEKRVKKVEGG